MTSSRSGRSSRRASRAAGLRVGSVKSPSGAPGRSEQLRQRFAEDEPVRACEGRERVGPHVGVDRVRRGDAARREQHAEIEGALERTIGEPEPAADPARSAAGRARDRPGCRRARRRRRRPCSRPLPRARACASTRRRRGPTPRAGQRSRSAAAPLAARRARRRTRRGSARAVPPGARRPPRPRPRARSAPAGPRRQGSPRRGRPAPRPSRATRRAAHRASRRAGAVPAACRAAPPAAASAIVRSSSSSATPSRSAGRRSRGRGLAGRDVAAGAVGVLEADGQQRRPPGDASTGDVHSGRAHLVEQPAPGLVVAHLADRHDVERLRRPRPEQDRRVVRDDVQLAVVPHVEQARGTALVAPEVVRAFQGEEDARPDAAHADQAGEARLSAASDELPLRVLR